MGMPTLPPSHLSRRPPTGVCVASDPAMEYEDHRGTVDPTWIPPEADQD